MATPANQEWKQLIGELINVRLHEIITEICKRTWWIFKIIIREVALTTKKQLETYDLGHNLAPTTKIMVKSFVNSGECTIRLLTVVISSLISWFCHCSHLSLPP